MSDDTPQPLTEAEAWQRYQADLQAVRELILESPLTNHDPQTRAEALALLPQIQAQAYLMIVAPRQDYPRFYTHEYFQPGVFSWNLPCPDFVYRTAFLDGRRRYRISGHRGTASWVEFQTYNCFNGVGHEQPRTLGNWDLDDFSADADGRFEIVVSAAPQAGNWIAIDAGAGNNWLLVRQLVYAGERAPQMSIEEIGGDELPRRSVLDEPELARRIALSGEMIRYVVTRMTHARLQDVVLKSTGGYNRFHSIVGAAPKDARDGTNPIAVYQIAAYEIEADEALLIETELPSCKYWNVHLGDILNQTRDYVHHRCSINDREARIDDDGVLRIVLSIGDPGMPNWLDSIGSVFGRVVWRWYGADRHVVPQIRRIKLSELPSLLPAATPRITAEQRRAESQRRVADITSRYAP
jgi:hypothetical protein